MSSLKLYGCTTIKERHKGFSSEVSEIVDRGNAPIVGHRQEEASNTIQRNPEVSKPCAREPVGKVDVERIRCRQSTRQFYAYALGRIWDAE